MHKIIGRIIHWWMHSFSILNEPEMHELPYTPHWLAIGYSQYQKYIQFENHRLVDRYFRFDFLLMCECVFVENEICSSLRATVWCSPCVYFQFRPSTCLRQIAVNNSFKVIDSVIFIVWMRNQNNKWINHNNNVIITCCNQIFGRTYNWMWAKSIQSQSLRWVASSISTLRCMANDLLGTFKCGSHACGADATPAAVSAVNHNQNLLTEWVKRIFHFRLDANTTIAPACCWRTIAIKFYYTN